MKGNITLNEKQRSLVEANLRLVGYMVQKMGVHGLDSWEDAYQVGTIGLMKAAYRFDERRGIKFTTFAAPCIANELRMVKRHENRESNRAVVLSLQDELRCCDDGSLTIGDMIADEGPAPEERLLYQETCRIIIEAVSHCKESNALLMLQMMLEKKKQTEIAEALGYTQSYVSRKQKRIREIIRQALL